MINSAGRKVVAWSEVYGFTRGGSEVLGQQGGQLLNLYHDGIQRGLFLSPSGSSSGEHVSTGDLL